MRIPRKLKKEKKKDGVYLLMRASVPIVSKILKYGNKTSLMDLLSPGSYNPETYNKVWRSVKENVFGAKNMNDVLNSYEKVDKNNKDRV